MQYLKASLCNSKISSLTEENFRCYTLSHLRLSLNSLKEPMRLYSLCRNRYDINFEVLEDQSKLIGIELIFNHSLSNKETMSDLDGLILHDLAYIQKPLAIKIPIDAEPSEIFQFINEDFMGFMMHHAATWKLIVRPGIELCLDNDNVLSGLLINRLSQK